MKATIYGGCPYVMASVSLMIQVMRKESYGKFTVLFKCNDADFFDDGVGVCFSKNRIDR